MKRSVLKQAWPIYWAAVLLCLGSGCVRSIQPILKDEQVFNDDRFLGSWVAKDGKTGGVVTATDDHKGYKLLYADENGKQADLLIRLGKVGDLTIAESSIADPAPEGSDAYKLHLLPLHSFMVVDKVEPQLAIKTVDSGWLAKYVAAHPGELATAALDKDNLIISAPTDDFQAFLLRHEKDDGIWTDEGIYVRPGDPSTQPSATPTTSAMK